MKNHPVTSWENAQPKWAVATAAAGAAAVVTLAATTGVRHVITDILAGYTVAVPTELETVIVAFTQAASAISITIPARIVAEGNWNLCLQSPIAGDEGTAITVTLSAGAATGVPFVNVGYR